MTLDKSTFPQDYDSHITYYPRNAKIIASTVKTTADERNLKANESEIQRAIDYCIENGIHVRFDKHFYFENGIKKEVLDGISLMPGKDYIINNFGTKQDDLILENLQREKDEEDDI